MACGSACGCAQPKHCLVKKLKYKRLLILRHIANNSTMSQSSMLKLISDSSDIPMSTLKLNMKMLLERGLAKRERAGDPIILTRPGRSVLESVRKSNAYV